MEARLVKEIKSGNQTAFKELYEYYVDYALRVATAITFNQTNAADAVQETFIRVYKSIHDFDETKPFKPWFYKILVNECNRYLKKHGKTIPFDINEELELSYDDDISTFTEYEDLYDAIQMLDDIHKVPLVLKYLKDFTEQDIAKILGLNINTLKSRLFKGKRKLKSLLINLKEGKRGEGSI